MLNAYFVDLVQIILSFLLSLLQVDANIAAALLPW